MSVIAPPEHQNEIASHQTMRPLPPVPVENVDELPPLPELEGSVVDSSLSSSMSSPTPSISSSTTTDTSITSASASLEMEQDSDSADDGRTMSTPTASVFKNVGTSVDSPNPTDTLVSSTSLSLPAVNTTSTSSTSSIRISSDSSNANLSPSPSILNVKFAPLPELAPRKRKSKMPLGIAARGQMALRRRAYYAEIHQQQNGYPPQGRPRYAVGEEDPPSGSHSMRRAAEEMDGVGKEQKKRKDKDAVSAENDPLVVFAKKLNKAGKQFWRKVASKEGKEKEYKEGHEEIKAREAEEEVETEQEEEEKKREEEVGKQQEEEEKRGEEEVGKQQEELGTEGTTEVPEMPREENGSPRIKLVDEAGLPMTMMTMSVMTTS